MFKIFPATLINHQKIPLIKGWREQASNDPTQIKLWQELFRDRIHFWGCPTGAINGIFALDIDIKTNGWDTIQKNGFQIPPTLSQRTLNGGSHFIFQFDPNRDTGNKVGFLPGLDLRSTGGWIALYQLDGNPILPAPEWLYQEVNRKPVQVAVQTSPIALAPEIAEGILKTSLDKIREAPPGESNNTLNVESFKVGQLVASGSVSRQFAEEELFKAAKDRGKPDYEAHATIKSGLDGGLKHPLTSPFGSEAPKASFEIPAIPEPPGKQERWTPTYLTRNDLLNTSKLRKPQLFRDWSTEDIQITTADGGTGKSTLKLFEAICLALGDRFLGFENVQRGKTLYITGEDTEGKLAAMMGAIMNQMGFMTASPENEAKIETILKSIVIKKDTDLCLIAKDKQNFLYPNPEAIRKINEAIDDFNPKMIVFDPIASFWGSEAALNDMNKAVTKFMSAIAERGICVEMINHMGKSSSASKDMTQFAGRGGSGLPSNSRVSRVLRSLPPEEYKELTGAELVGDQSAILCNVNKFSDGSVLFNKPFIIIREGYLFRKITLSQAKAREMEQKQSDTERVFTFIKQQRLANKYPSLLVLQSHFANCGDPLSRERVKEAIAALVYGGHMGEKLLQIENPDLTRKEKVFIVTDLEGKENV